MEVEQAPDGTLISCVNPVTGEGLNAGNSKEVITGTAAAPFGDYTLAKIAEQLQNGDISIIATFDASALGVQAPIYGPMYVTGGEYPSIRCDGASFTFGPNGAGATYNSSYVATWSVDNPELTVLIMNAGGTTTNATSYMNAVTSSLTIYHHPMP